MKFLFIIILNWGDKRTLNITDFIKILRISKKNLPYYKTKESIFMLPDEHSRKLKDNLGLKST